MTIALGWYYGQWVLGIALVGFLLARTVYFVPQQRLWLIERFGKYHRTAAPGLLLLIPFVERRAHALSLRTFQLTLKLSTKTKDNVFVVVFITVQYQAIPELIYDAAYRLNDVASQITSYVENVVRAQFPTVTLDAAFEHMSETGNAVREVLGEVMRGFGYEIVAVLVTDIEPDSKVREQMNAINAAQREQVAAEAQGEAARIRTVKAAEAEAQSKRLQGEGIAQQRRAIIDGLRESAKELQEALPGTSEQDVLTLMMMTQYFDTLGSIGAPGDRVLFLPASPAGMSGFANEIRTALLSAKAAS